MTLHPRGRQDVDVVPPQPALQVDDLEAVVGGAQSDVPSAYDGRIA
jgi:hypothetical protein